MLFSLFSSLLAAAILSNVILRGIGLESINLKTVRVKPVLVETSIISGMALLVFLIDFVVFNFILVPLNATYLNLLVVTLLVIVINEAYIYLTKKIKLELPVKEQLGLHSVLLIVGFFGFNMMSFDLAFIGVLGSLIGFILFSILLVIIHSRLRVSPMLKAFKGLPILLIVIGLIALIMNGLGGIF